MAPVWSPSGDKIAVTTDNYTGILVADASGTNLRRLTSDAGVGYKMTWTADGSRIVGRTNVAANRMVLHELKAYDVASAKSSVLVAKNRFDGTPAASQVRQMIQKVGLQPGDYRVADGSGLSLYNYVSAELEVAMLRYVWQHAGLFRQLNIVLPVAGVDGTLKDRMQKSKAYRNVRAKTGTLTGISSLAGYLTAANGHQFAFCIINQGVVKEKDGKDFQDKVCRYLCE